MDDFRTGPVFLAVVVVVVAAVIAGVAIIMVKSVPYCVFRSPGVL